MSAFGGRESFASNVSGASLESQSQLETLREKLIAFYSVVDPHKLEDETKINELVLWARKYSAMALVRLIHRKYGMDLDEVDNSERGWMEIYGDLKKFYARHDRDKDPEEIDKIFQWTRKHGLARLNEKLVQNYGVPLSSVKSNGGSNGNISKWKNRFQHVIVNQEVGNLTDQIRAFYKQFEPNKPPHEIEKVVRFGFEYGREAVNEKLFEKYGKTLNDVQLVEGATSDERYFNLKTKLERFFEEHKPEELENAAAIDALVQWGLLEYRQLNDHLLRSYGYNLETKTIDPEKLKLELFDYFTKRLGKVKRTQGELEELVQFAVANGREALSQKLFHKYGAPLPEEGEEDMAQVLSAQAPKMTRTSVGKNLRKSLSNAFRKSLSR